MTDVQRVADYIQRFSELIGVPIDPLDKEGFTQVARGSATVGINVIEQKGFILFLAPIMEVPAQRREELYRTLLELNYLATEDGAFAIDKASGRVYLRALRSLDAFDFDEFVDMLDTIARVADEWDDKLKGQFGA
ncbi:MAG: YbjN domain-containing protein [Polyangia bacterium]